MTPRCRDKMHSGKLVSLLDIMGGYIVCDGCGAETKTSISVGECQRESAKSGWTFGVKDLCDKCSNPSSEAAS